MIFESVPDPVLVLEIFYISVPVLVPILAIFSILVLVPVPVLFFLFFFNSVLVPVLVPVPVPVQLRNRLFGNFGTDIEFLHFGSCSCSVLWIKIYFGSCSGSVLIFHNVRIYSFHPTNIPTLAPPTTAVFPFSYFVLRTSFVRSFWFVLVFVLSVSS